MALIRRALMHRLLRSRDKRRRRGYTRRWQVETVMSMIKRNQGEELSGHGYHSRNRQMRMLAVVHNILLVLFMREVCDGAGQKPILGLSPPQAGCWI